MRSLWVCVLLAAQTVGQPYLPVPEGGYPFPVVSSDCPATMTVCSSETTPYVYCDDSGTYSDCSRTISCDPVGVIIADGASQASGSAGCGPSEGTGYDPGQYMIGTFGQWGCLLLHLLTLCRAQ